jgi:hypothetical protein
LTFSNISINIKENNTTGISISSSLDDEFAKFRFNAIFVFFLIGDVSEFEDDCIERFEVLKDIGLFNLTINMNGL